MKNKIEKIIRSSLIVGSLMLLIISASHSISADAKLKKSEKPTKNMAQVRSTDVIDGTIRPTAGWTNGLTTGLAAAILSAPTLARQRLNR